MNEKLLKIILSLNADRAEGYGGISISMLKLRSLSKIKALFIIFQNCLKADILPDDCKKENSVSIHKKSREQSVDNS